MCPAFLRRGRAIWVASPFIGTSIHLPVCPHKTLAASNMRGTACCALRHVQLHEYRIHCVCRAPQHAHAPGFTSSQHLFPTIWSAFLHRFITSASPPKVQPRSDTARPSRMPVGGEISVEFIVAMKALTGSASTPAFVRCHSHVLVCAKARKGHVKDTIRPDNMHALSTAGCRTKSPDPQPGRAIKHQPLSVTIEVRKNTDRMQGYIKDD